MCWGRMLCLVGWMQGHVTLASQEIRAGHLGPRCTAGLILGKRMRQIVQLGALH